jgi:hypothetical protein
MQTEVVLDEGHLLVMVQVVEEDLGKVYQKSRWLQDYESTLKARSGRHVQSRCLEKLV